MENKQKTALLVEDDPDIRFGLEGRLEHLGYNVIAVEQADAAIPEIAELKNLGKKPDLLVTDHNTPGTMTGLQLLETIKQDGIKSIIWTAGSTKEFEQQARDAGALAAFKKPNDSDKLKAKLAELAKNPNAGKDSIRR